MNISKTDSQKLDFRESLIEELGFRDDSLLSLKQYMNLLWAANDELNLFSRKMPHQDLIDNHLIDCLLPLSHLSLSLKSIADFGSGGGMPGVVYALSRPNAQVHLFEKSPKKRDFLNQCREFAPNLVVHGEIPNELKGIELITARAFKPIDVILDLSRNHYRQKGRYFLLKGRQEKIQEELQLALKKFKDLKAQTVPLKSPILEVERNLVLI